MASLGTLSSVNSTLLPPNVVDDIFTQTTEASAVQQLAGRVPLALNAQTAIPISMDVPVPGWVSEGGVKPVGSGAVGVKMMSGKKLAILVPVSEELARTNSAGLYEQLRRDVPVGFARAFDYACIHGKDLRTGGAGPFSDYLKATPNSVELGTKNQASGGMYADLVTGEQAVVNAGFDYAGTAIDPRLKPLLKLQVDSTGRPIWVDQPQNGLNSSNLIGYPAAANRGVSGIYNRNNNRLQTVTLTGSPTGGTFTISGNGNTTSGIAYNAAAAAVQTAVRTLGGPFSAATVSGTGPWAITVGTLGVATGPLTASGAGLTGGTNPTAVVSQTNTQDISSLRGIGGDWSQARWGQGMDITVKVSTEASYVDEASVTHSAFQENLVLLLVEAYYGFVMGDPKAFVAFIDAA
jgi:hypothetical protein